MGPYTSLLFLDQLEQTLNKLHPVHLVVAELVCVRVC